jgi:hypothetical protein
MILRVLNGLEWISPAALASPCRPYLWYSRVDPWLPSRIPTSDSPSAPPPSGLSRSGPLGLRFGEVRAYRELLYFFVWRDVKIRYKQTAIGVLWVALEPVLTIPFVVQFWMLAILSPIPLRCSLALSLALWIEPLNL